MTTAGGDAEGPPDQSFRPEDRLRRRADYQRCYRGGRRRGGRFATLHHQPNDQGRPRLGITASRKVGPAVVRQRLKRRVREVFRRFSGRRQLPASDLVIHLKPSARDATFAALRHELERQLRGIARGDSDGRRGGRR